MGMTSMETAAKTSFFFTNFSPLRLFCEIPHQEISGGFYQQITSGLTKGLIELQAVRRYADRLVALANQAHPLRRMDIVEQASRTLLNLPLTPDYSSVGQYYAAICAGRRGEVAEARASLEQVAEKGSLTFRARAMMSLGGYCHKLGDGELGLPFFVEAGRAAIHIEPLDPAVTLQVQRMIAALKGEDGDHKRSLDDLEKILPLARAVGREYPPLLSDYFNSYAVELPRRNVGRSRS